MQGTSFRILLVGAPSSAMDELFTRTVSMAPAWKIQRCLTIEEAVAAMKAVPVDIVATDGKQVGLLRRVQEESPKVIRLAFLLSEERSLSIEISAQVHRCLPLPCDPELFSRAVLELARNEETSLDGRIKEIVNRLGEFPSPPAGFQRMLKLLNDSKTPVESLVIIIEQDPSVAAKVMQVANSALFGEGGSVTSVREAIPLLGFHLIKGIVLVKEAFQKFPAPIPGGIVLDELWSHSVRTGILASDLALDRYQNRPMADEAFASALMHDFGKLILQAAFGQVYVEVLHESRRRKEPLWKVEKKFYGVSHADVGAYLLKLWGLSESTVMDIRFHHEPRKCEAKNFTSLTALHLANVMDHQMQPVGSYETGGLDADYLRWIGVSDRIEDWKKE